MKLAEAPETAAPRTGARASSFLGALPLDDLERQVADGPFEQAYGFTALYEDGRWLSRKWSQGSTVSDALERAFEQASEEATQAQPTEVVVVVPYDYSPLNEKTHAHVFSNVHRGVHGAGIWHGNRALLVSPTEVIARNQTLATLLDRLAEDLGRDLTELMAENRAFSFRARQFFVRLGPGPRSVEMLRGSELVDLKAVTRERVQQFEREMSQWMLNNVQRDGRMTYMYLPSRSAEEAGNNMIRQSMATACLGRIARRGLTLGSERSARHVADLNLRYHLDRFYRQDGRLGFIECQGKAYLGSAALTLIAILENPERHELSAQEEGLRATIDHLWQKDGSFRTWLRPATRNDNQNFFPGEALLAWSLLYKQERDPHLLNRFMASYGYYRNWHLRNRDPAFVPWHTQAYCQLLDVEQPPGLGDWVFEMNDWLLGMQARSMQVYEDTLGRFYDPERPFGPPHASSTGVYLEGLIDAFCLARSVQDLRRVRAYRRAILHGLRSALQLEYLGDAGLFYVSARERVRGGLRTSVYNNKVRVDNVQHVLMGVQKILQQFEAEDFEPY